jgi:hypothetical protein
MSSFGKEKGEKILFNQNYQMIMLIQQGLEILRHGERKMVVIFRKF